MSKYHGPQPGHKSDRDGKKNGPKGVERNHRQLKREEAEARQKVYDAKHDPGTEGEELAAELIEEEEHDKGKASG